MGPGERDEAGLPRGSELAVDAQRPSAVSLMCLPLNTRAETHVHVNENVISGKVNRYGLMKTYLHRSSLNQARMIE